MSRTIRSRQGSAAAKRIGPGAVPEPAGIRLLVVQASRLHKSSNEVIRRKGQPRRLHHNTHSQKTQDATPKSSSKLPGRSRRSARSVERTESRLRGQEPLLAAVHEGIARLTRPRRVSAEIRIVVVQASRLHKSRDEVIRRKGQPRRLHHNTHSQKTQDATPKSSSKLPGRSRRSTRSVERTESRLRGQEPLLAAVHEGIARLTRPRRVSAEIRIVVVQASRLHKSRDEVIRRKAQPRRLHHNIFEALGTSATG